MAAEPVATVSSGGRRLPINADDPPEVFEEVARLLTHFRDRIESDVERLRAQCVSAAEFQAVRDGYLAAIVNISPEPVTQAAIERIAVLKFRRAEAKPWER